MNDAPATNPPTAGDGHGAARNAPTANPPTAGGSHDAARNAPAADPATTNNAPAGSPPTADGDRAAAIAAQVAAAHNAETPLAIIGGSSKGFYGETVRGNALPVKEHAGILAYEPDELFLQARAGTPLADIERVLRERGQILPFEPPHFGPGATFGGCLAAGLSGPARMARGAVRDAALGATIVDGRGRVLRFGGRVMKNVAGYDLSRLMCGALGTLGVILDATVRLAPAPRVETTRVFECDEAEALRRANDGVRRGWPISASFHDGQRLYLRLSGHAHGVASAARAVGGEACDDAGLDAGPSAAPDAGPDANLWTAVREQRHPFFQSDAPLWRLSLPVAAPSPELPGARAFEWHGGARWLFSDAPAAVVRAAAARCGGAATLFRSQARAPAPDAPVFHPPSDALMTLHCRLKDAFDPARILNPGRLFYGL